MKTRAVLAVMAVAGLASAVNAQESITYTLSFVEVLAGTNTAVTNPNGIIEPGEGARVQLRATINPGIGSPSTYLPPPAPGNGTIAGLGSVFFDLNQTNATGGTWGPFGRAGGFTLGDAGTGNADGSLSAAQAGQFILPGSTANSTNPINNIWRGTWTPSSYASRTVTFTSVGAFAAAGNHSSILIQYGTDAGGNPLYVAKYIAGQFGNIQIPVVPSPSSLALLGLGGLVAGRRRR